uniref:Uncharacterized protein n=1 Tax=Mola mola TaxID=94237 RepID=A0A3Q3VZQ7_MOLML
MVTLTAPYIAGFLAFRETPFLLDALKRLQRNKPELLPQVVFVDGNGLFHYRGKFGLACHFGVLSGLPCVGVAKNLLQVQGVCKGEEHQSQVRGDSFPLIAASGKVLGKTFVCDQALRSSNKSSKPVYVSVGHKISLDTAVRLTHSCCRYRIPEPIRQVRTHVNTEPEAGRDALLYFVGGGSSSVHKVLSLRLEGGWLKSSRDQLVQRWTGSRRGSRGDLTTDICILPTLWNLFCHSSLYPM